MLIVLALSVLVTLAVSDRPSGVPTCPNQGIDPGFTCDGGIQRCNSFGPCPPGTFCCQYGGCGDTRCQGVRVACLHSDCDVAVSDRPSGVPTCPNQGIDPGFTCDGGIQRCNSYGPCRPGTFCCQYGGCGDTRCQSLGGSNICLLPLDPGPCRGSFPRWYYDANTFNCVRFIYGGCGGNENNFLTQSQCLSRCAAEPMLPPGRLNGRGRRRRHY